jgi:hypothetical protein
VTIGPRVLETRLTKPVTTVSIIFGYELLLTGTEDKTKIWYPKKEIKDKQQESNPPLAGCCFKHISLLHIHFFDYNEK